MAMQTRVWGALGASRAVMIEGPSREALELVEIR
jgi:hypothetical protein